MFCPGMFCPAPVFEKLVLFCGPERGEERIILLVLARITILAVIMMGIFGTLDSK